MKKLRVFWQKKYWYKMEGLILKDSSFFIFNIKILL